LKHGPKVGSMFLVLKHWLVK